MLQTSQSTLQPEFIHATDSLWRHTPTPWTADYNLLGLPLTVETNAPALAEQAAIAFMSTDVSEEPNTPQSATPIRLRLLLHDVEEILPGNLAPLMRAQDHYFLLCLGQSLGFADRCAGFAVACITPALLAQPEILRTCFVECLAMYLACGRGRAPLHAAGLMWAHKGVLLTGQDGAGKSTLTYACLRAGFRLLSEDMAYAPELQADEPLTLWGDARLLHLLPDALRFFPELEDAPRIQQMNGESKLRVHVGRRWPDAPLTRMSVVGVCSLGRSGGTETCLRAADRQAVRRALTHFKGDPPLDADVQRRAADRLLTARLAHLEVGTDLDRAVAVLQRWIEQCC
jgi:hypothetical protein